MADSFGSELTPRDWKLFDDWHPPGDTGRAFPNWQPVVDLLSAFSGAVNEYYADLYGLLKQWDSVLHDFGGDPTYRDWRKFRPLRLSREEDWSDWLAFLIESSQTGVFCACLLHDPPSGLNTHIRAINVEREVAQNYYRGDIIVHWSGGFSSHIEVKIGDANLLKMYDTGRELRAKYGKKKDEWKNFILLLPEQVAAWEGLPAAPSEEPPIQALTWEDIAIALRRGLHCDETSLWKAWAYGFVGAIEQQLLMYPGYRLESRRAEGISTKIRILREGLRSV